MTEFAKPATEGLREIVLGFLSGNEISETDREQYLEVIASASRQDAVIVGGRRAIACLEFEEKRYVNRSNSEHNHETQTRAPASSKSPPAKAEAAVRRLRHPFPFSRPAT